MSSAGGVSPRQPQSFKQVGDGKEGKSPGFTVGQLQKSGGSMVMTELKIDNDLTTAGAEGAQAPQMPGLTGAEGGQPKSDVNALV